jgi:hypothetical protein
MRGSTGERCLAPLIGISLVTPSMSTVVLGPGQRVQDQSGTDGVEFALYLPHAVAALLQFQMPAVWFQLIIDRCRPVGIYSVGQSIRDSRRSSGPNPGRVWSAAVPPLLVRQD